MAKTMIRKAIIDGEIVEYDMMIGAESTFTLREDMWIFLGEGKTHTINGEKVNSYGRFYKKITNHPGGAK
mgnify:CR=1 FL=1